MTFTAKAVDMTLELINAEGVKKSFNPKERITGDFATKILKEMSNYFNTQKELPESEQDRLYQTNLKFLSWMYKDLDTKWIKEHFNFAEINEIKSWAFQGLNGIKKEEES